MWTLVSIENIVKRAFTPTKIRTSVGYYEAWEFVSEWVVVIQEQRGPSTKAACVGEVWDQLEELFMVIKEACSQGLQGWTTGIHLPALTRMFSLPSLTNTCQTDDDLPFKWLYVTWVVGFWILKNSSWNFDSVEINGLKNPIFFEFFWRHKIWIKLTSSHPSRPS